MKNITIKTGIYFLVVFGLVSCKTYYIPIDSFKQQFKDIDLTELKMVNTRGPMGDVVSYKTYPIEYIKCVDKKNNPFELRNSPAIEIRFTEKNNKRTTLYFDQIFIQDSLIIGDGSRFINYQKVIPLNNIKVIEVQDGHKNFKYVERTR